MDVNRNQYFLMGLVLLLLGSQFRLTESVLLTPQFTQFLAERTEHPVAAAGNAVEAVAGVKAPLPPKTIRPPDWIGYSLLSLAAVLILHSLSMKRPE